MFICFYKPAKIAEILELSKTATTAAKTNTSTTMEKFAPITTKNLLNPL
jgi:hypothetical protein